MEHNYKIDFVGGSFKWGWCKSVGEKSRLLVNYMNVFFSDRQTFKGVKSFGIHKN